MTTLSDWQQRCTQCGWLGPRQVREVNFDHLTRRWICAVCWFQPQPRSDSSKVTAR